MVPRMGKAGGETKDGPREIEKTDRNIRFMRKEEENLEKLTEATKELGEQMEAENRWMTGNKEELREVGERLEERIKLAMKAKEVKRSAEEMDDTNTKPTTGTGVVGRKRRILSKQGSN